MPYINRASRKVYDELIDKLIVCLVTANKNRDGVKGHLNYIIFKMVRKLLKNYGESYSYIQDLIGTLECCKQEVTTRILRPYEDSRIELYGDVL